MKALDISLTRNQQLVFETLQREKTPLSAYHILERLKDQGLRAPPQIYRALDKLVGLGLVHRLDTLNAFVACQHPTCGPHRMSAFAICDDCHSVSEISDSVVSEQLHALATATGLTPTQSTIELRGVCQRCDSTTA